MENVRAFVAIELPEEFKNYLKEVQRKVSGAHSLPAKWVKPESIHLTLKFLGYVAADKILAIEQALEDAAQATHPFSLGIAGLGAFPSLKRVEVVWVGLGGELAVLQELVRRLEEAFEGLGFPPEKRPFTPHLTLARVRPEAGPLERQNLGQAISAAQLDCDLKLKVESLSLMQSHLTRAGALYSCLKSARLS